MKIQTINSDKLITFENQKIRIFNPSLIDGTKYITWKNDGSRLNFNENKILISYHIRQKNISINSDGFLVYKTKCGLLYSMDLIKNDYKNPDSFWIPKIAINEGRKILKKYNI